MFNEEPNSSGTSLDYLYVLVKADDSWIGEQIHGQNPRADRADHE